MNLVSKLGISVVSLAALSLGIGAGCSSGPPEDVATSTAQPLKIIRASKETTQKVGVTQWTVEQTPTGVIARGVDAKGNERGLFELGGERDVDGKLTALTVRTGYGLKSSSTRFTPGGEPPKMDPGVRPFVERVNADLEAAARVDAKTGTKPQGLGILDWEDECYECNKPPPPSPVSSTCAGVSVAALLFCSASLISCGAGFVPGCATSWTGCGGLFATTVIACNATAPTPPKAGGGGGGGGSPPGQCSEAECAQNCGGVQASCILGTCHCGT